MKTEKQPRIFIVDDDVITLNVLLQQLKNNGFTDITPFKDEHHCLNSLCYNPDIILLDYQLSLLDGLELLKRIRRSNPNVYIVILSGQENVEVVVNCYRYGAFDYVIKNDNQEQRIAQVIQKIIGKLNKKEEKKSLLRQFLDLF